MTSFVTRSSSTLESLTQSRPKIDIELTGQTEGLVSSYTTKDRIEGTAVITVDRDTRFDDVEISFEGKKIPGRIDQSKLEGAFTHIYRDIENFRGACSDARPYRRLPDIPPTSPTD